MKSLPVRHRWIPVLPVVIGLAMTSCVFLLLFSDESPSMADYDTWEEYEQARVAYDARTGAYATVATSGMILAILGGILVHRPKWLIKKPVAGDMHQIPLVVYTAIVAIMFALSLTSWFMARTLFGVCVVAGSIAVAIRFGRIPGALSKSLKVLTIFMGFGLVIAMFFIEPLWMGALALAAAIVFFALVAKETRQASVRTRAVIVGGILLFDASLILVYPHLWSLTVAMPLASLLIILALIAYPRSYPSMPADNWQ